MENENEDVSLPLDEKEGQFLGNALALLADKMQANGKKCASIQVTCSGVQYRIYVEVESSRYAGDN